MLPDETILSGVDNSENYQFRVCKSAAGYYIGTFTREGFPYSRETGYFLTFEEAEIALESFNNTGNLPKQRM